MTSRITVTAHTGNSHGLRIEHPDQATMHLAPGESREIDFRGSQALLLREGQLVPQKVIDASEGVVTTDKAETVVSNRDGEAAPVIAQETIDEVRAVSDAAEADTNQA